MVNTAQTTPIKKDFSDFTLKCKVLLVNFEFQSTF